MSAQRFFRPVSRAFQRPGALLRPIERSSIFVRPAAVAPMSTKPANVQPQTPVKNTRIAIPMEPMQKMNALKAAMPQLTPFFFVNETVFAFTLIPLLVYVFSKYLLPQRVRVRAARLFVSKL